MRSSKVVQKCIFWMYFLSASSRQQNQKQSPPWKKNHAGNFGKLEHNIKRNCCISCSRNVICQWTLYNEWGKNSLHFLLLLLYNELSKAKPNKQRSPPESPFHHAKALRNIINSHVSLQGTWDALKALTPFLQKVYSSLQPVMKDGILATLERNMWFRMASPLRTSFSCVQVVA